MMTKLIGLLKAVFLLSTLCFYFAKSAPVSQQRTSLDCCPENTYFNHDTNLCSNGDNVNLNCSFVYIELMAHSSHHLVDESDNDTIRSVEDAERILTPDKFCFINRVHEVNIILMCKSEITKLVLRNEVEIEITTSNNYFMWKFYLYTSLMTISGFFCILTILTYASFSELWNTQDKLIMYTIYSLLVTTMSFNFVHLNPYLIDYYYICIILAFLLYYFTLATYFWLNILGFNIWRQVWFKKFFVREQSLFIFYNIIGWGTPTCFLIVALITNQTDGAHLKPTFGIDNCWFTDITQIWTYCTGPIALLLTIDVVYVVLSSWKLCRDLNQFEQLRYKTLRYRRTMYLKLILVMGSDWICEILSSIWPSENFSIPLEIINALQGVFVFIILVVQRVKVKKILVVKKPWGINFPKSWTQQPDEEYDTMLSNGIQSMILGNHWTFFVY